MTMQLAFVFMNTDITTLEIKEQCICVEVPNFSKVIKKFSSETLCFILTVLIEVERCNN